MPCPSTDLVVLVQDAIICLSGVNSEETIVETAYVRDTDGEAEAATTIIRQHQLLVFHLNAQ